MEPITDGQNLKEIRTKGQQLLQHRLEFADAYLIYHSAFHNQERIIHAIADAHTHLTHFLSFSPRIVFYAEQRGCGKSTALELSYFFVQNPLMRRNCGAGLLREIRNEKVDVNDQPYDGYIPTILYDELQNTLDPRGGNRAVADALSMYTKGFERVIEIDGAPVKQDLFCPVIAAALIADADLPADFLERAIVLPMEKPLPEQKASRKKWLFDLMRQDQDKNGECPFRQAWESWAADIPLSVLKAAQEWILADLDDRIEDGRHLQLVMPLALTAYMVGRDYYDQTIEAAKVLLANRVVPYTEPEQILADAHAVIADRTNVIEDWFLPSEVLRAKLRAMPERKWGEYKQEGITTERISFLLKKNGIAPEYNTDKTQRGYNVATFVAPWKRKVNLDKPAWMKELC